MNQDTLVRDLRKQVSTGRLAIVVGTGIAIQACGDQEVDGHPVARWDGLLLHGVDHCLNAEHLFDSDDADLVRRQVKSGKPDFLVVAAELIATKLHGKSPGTYHRWLKETLGALEPANPEILRVISNFPGLLATLNYDPLFEKATGRTAVTWMDEDKVEEILRCDKTNAILHLHGYYDKPDSVVLGLSSYVKVAESKHTKSVLQLFTIDRTLLFIGCGGTFGDPNFSRLLNWAEEARAQTTHRHFLLCREEELTPARAILHAAPWLHPVSYGKSYDDLLPFLANLLKAAKTSPAPSARHTRGGTDPGFDFNAYRQAMRKRYGRLKLEDLDPTTHDIKPLTVTGMFIPQTVRECTEFLPRVFELPKELQQHLRDSGQTDLTSLDSETLEQARRAYHDQTPRPVLQLVRDPTLNRLVLLGDPGSGKSMLAQFLLLEWAEQSSADLRKYPLSLLIELREYARLRQERKVSSFLQFLHEGAAVRWHFSAAELHNWLKDNPSSICFDGLDEVFDPEQRKEIAICIHRFADEYPQARVLVSSRIIGYRHQAWRDEGFRHFMLQELDDHQINDFLARWHRAAYSDSCDATEKQERLARAIADAPAIRQLAGNPLLLTMMAILNRTQDLPRDRAELYEQCARLLLHQWKAEQAFAADPELAKAALDYKDKRALLLRVARSMQTSGQGLAGNLIAENALERTLAEGLQGIPSLRAERAARALIEQLRGRNFMLCAVGSQHYAFVHRTFLEYFCAQDIRLRFEQEQTLTLEQLKTQVYGTHWKDESWHEVLRLLSGLLAPRFVREVIEFLLQQQDPEQTCHHLFLAGRCVGEVRKRVELGNANYSTLQRLKVLTRFDLNYWYEDWDDDALGQVEEIRTRAVSVVAQTWSKEAKTLAWLRACARSDKDSGVRQTAVQELARGWKDHPLTLSWLQACARSDKDSDVRQTAVQELAQGWKDHPQTLPIIQACAQSDKDSGVRQTAVQELARG